MSNIENQILKRIELVEIKPVEWDLKAYRALRYVNVIISKNLTQAEFEEILKRAKVEDSRVVCNPNNYLIYQYRNRPLLYIDLENNKIFTHKSIYGKEFDVEDIEHQASIILRILRSFGKASFKRKFVNFNPKRIGYNEAEREQYYEICRRGIKRRLEIYGFTPLVKGKKSRKKANESKNLSALKRAIEVK